MKRIIRSVFAMTMAVALLCTNVSATGLASLGGISSSQDARITSFIEAKILSLGESMTVANVRHVSDFAGNDYAVVECEPLGYFILHPASGVIVEYNLCSKSPYTIEAASKGISFYGGPTNYYVQSTDAVEHLILEETISDASAKGMVSQSATINDELMENSNARAAAYLSGDTSVSPTEATSGMNTKGTDYWVTTYTWFQNRKSGFGYKSGDYCGYIAANLVLKYFDYRNKISLPDAAAVTNSTVLTDTLIGFGNSNLSTGASISSVINSYASYVGIPQSATWATGVSGVTTEIGTYKRPCILFGDVPSFTSGFIFHAVTAYGYNTYENEGYTTFVCHYGWNKSSSYDFSTVHITTLNCLFGTNAKYRV